MTKALYCLRISVLVQVSRASRISIAFRSVGGSFRVAVDSTLPGFCVAFSPSRDIGSFTPSRAQALPSPILEKGLVSRSQTRSLSRNFSAVILSL